MILDSFRQDVRVGLRVLLKDKTYFTDPKLLNTFIDITNQRGSRANCPVVNQGDISKGGSGSTVSDNGAGPPKPAQ